MVTRFGDRLTYLVSDGKGSKYTYTELRTPFTFSSNTHLFKETRGQIYQFRERYFNFWIFGYSLNYPFD